MKVHKIAVIAGDGIGPEVIAEGVKVLEAVARIDGDIHFEFTYFPWGCEYYLEHGTMMPDDGLEQLKKFEAVYLGAVGYPGVPDHISLRELLLKIRKEFDQYVNVRPVRLLQGAPCPLKDVTRDQIDMVVIGKIAKGSTQAPVIGFLKASRRKSSCKREFFHGKERRGSFAMRMSWHAKWGKV